MTFPEDLAQKAERSLAKLGVQTKMSTMVHEVDRDGVRLQVNGSTEHISSKTVIWAGGVTVSPLARTLAKRTGAETDHGGRIKVGPDLTIANFPDIYVVGDLALSLDAKGKPLAGVAQVAMQGGAYAAKAILRKAKGQAKPKAFKYFDKGNMAVIGRASAVADIFGVHVSGLLAWLVWAFIHLAYIVEFQSRILVFIQWAIQDLTFSRGARLITGLAPTDFNFNREMAAGGGTVAPTLDAKSDSGAVPVH
jgi:NADH dehydrogenase